MLRNPNRQPGKNKHSYYHCQRRDSMTLRTSYESSRAILKKTGTKPKIQATVVGNDLISPGVGRVPGAQQQISHHCTIRLIGFYHITHALYFLYSLTLAGSLGIAVGNKSDKKKEARWLNPGKRIRKSIWTGMITRRRRAPIVIDSRRETE